MEFTLNTVAIINALIFSLIGIIVLVISFWIAEKITPENLWKEIIVNKNVPLSIMAAGFMLAIAIIIGAAIIG